MDVVEHHTSSLLLILLSRGNRKILKSTRRDSNIDRGGGGRTVREGGVEGKEALFSGYFQKRKKYRGKTQIMTRKGDGN